LDTDAKVDCAWGMWSAWSYCSETCDGGVHTRVRSAAWDARNGGAPCEGLNKEFKKCNEQPCPVNCHFGFWSEWTDCSQTCGGGEQIKKRVWAPAAAHGGLPCEGERVENRKCYDEQCPQDCLLDDWTDWTECPATCGGAFHTRERPIIDPPLFGGKTCETNLAHTEACGEVNCPIHCNWELWTSWSACSTTCGAGHQLRTRAENQKALHGGSACPGEGNETKDCFENFCDHSVLVNVDTGNGIVMPMTLTSNWTDHDPLIKFKPGETFSLKVVQTLAPTTKKGCTCLANWLLQGFPKCATEANGHCCNPDNEATGDWCFTQGDCGGENWDNCVPRTAGVAFTSPS